MYTYTDPKVDIGVGLEPDPFDIDRLEDHFKEHTKVTEIKHQMERIPLMERTTPTTEVMPLKEFENNIGKFYKLCRMYGETSCELSAGHQDRKRRLQEHMMHCNPTSATY